MPWAPTWAWPAGGPAGGRLPDGGPRRIDIEHPSGHLEVEVEVDAVRPPRVRSAGVIRTARKLFDGIAYPRR